MEITGRARSRTSEEIGVVVPSAIIASGRSSGVGEIGVGSERL